ncbi:four-carbon acid sugar kinase family protein [Streptomyces luomodiensis]|uniref:Four-carbon acid sugar kinase family protein n=1 Tax=Streptomyces luomodiensis TaxID=3026192 RepID=A0ABY9UTB7_9ACTN|nr:four-carbon acid sugar kinase family protein [Streptomyces sp. SCA4-21]WNE95227.1 four-carbon acid sugar kinase family protein [Streptomyces sp. SCA4-21]
MKTIVLDDDPTGTQSASDVPVLLDHDTDLLTDTLRHDDAAYILTNSRAIPEDAAVTLVGRIREAGAEAARRLGTDVRFVLRGDSTLRGHVFAESDVFASPDSVLLFLPAFPAGGRTTRDGIHWVRIGGTDVPAGETEYARDPVFGFRSSTMAGYVAEAGGGRKVLTVPLAELRATAGDAVARALGEAAPGTVIAPDAVTDEDIDLVHQGLERAWAAGRRIVVRCAAPLAARCSAAVSPGLLPAPLRRPAGPVLVVCGSHTSGATRQLATVERHWAARPLLLDTDRALTDPAAAGRDLVERAHEQLRTRGVAVLASERERSARNNTLDHGERVMTGLTTAVRELAGAVAAVVAKGGITSAEVARTGLRTSTARVRGQMLAGVSVWDLRTPSGVLPYVVVPGNVGGDDTLDEVLRRLGVPGRATS